MAPFTDFYVSFSQNVAVISKRRGLSESVEADRTRRRTVYYDETFKSVKENILLFHKKIKSLSKNKMINTRRKKFTKIGNFRG